MYLVGLDHRSRSLYSTITIMISLPATIKTVNWTLTLLNGALKIDIALLFSFAYILVFVVGGFTGMWLSHVGLNISMHDTYYVVAHFHLMLAGNTLIGIFAGFYYYFQAFFSIKYSKIFGFLHLIYYVGGQWLTFLPMFWLGFSGLPRRIHDYPIIFTSWQSMASTGHFVTITGIVFFFLMLLDSHIDQKLLISPNLGLPRWHKRVQYYFFKITYLQLNKKYVFHLPSHNFRKAYMLQLFNEYNYYIKIHD
jgi:cytochrome c oxidase subunit 1